MKFEQLSEIVPVLDQTLVTLNANKKFTAWAVTAKVEHGDQRWDVKVDADGHVTTQRQS